MHAGLNAVSWGLLRLAIAVGAVAFLAVTALVILVLVIVTGQAIAGLAPQ